MKACQGRRAMGQDKKGVTKNHLSNGSVQKLEKLHCTHWTPEQMGLQLPRYTTNENFHNYKRITQVPKEEIWFVCSWLASSIVLFVLVASFSTNLLYSFLWLTNISSGIYWHTCIVRYEREMYEHLYNTLIIVDLHQSSCGHKSNTKQRKYRCLTYLFITCIHCISRSFGPCITIGDAEPSQQGSNSAYVPSLNFPSLIDRSVHISIPKHSDENHAQMN